VTQPELNETTHNKSITVAHTLAGSGRLQELQKLLEKQPHLVFARDSNGWTPLHEAARGGYIAVADHLVQMGADVDAVNIHGGTPLYEAEKYHGKDSALVRYLVSLGALRQESKARLRGTNIKRPYLAHTLAGDGRMDELNQLLELRGPSILEERDENGWTPLHEASHMGRIHVVRFLVEHGADINARNKAGETPLYYAESVGGKDAAVSRFLRELGCLH
jgi:ankyrin repeat protein